MSDGSLAHWLALPIGLGLVGFVEPCSIGTTLLFVKSLESHDSARKLAQVATFMATRAVFMGALGLAAIALGAAFLGWQRLAWAVFGTLYVVAGLLYAGGRAGWLAHTLGPGLGRFASVDGAAALGGLFALNIPACAAPLLFALIGATASGGAGGMSPLTGFVSLALFGVALSLPVAVMVAFPRTRRFLDAFAGLSRRAPFWTGLTLIGLGLWSIGFVLFVTLKPAG